MTDREMRDRLGELHSQNANPIDVDISFLYTTLKESGEAGEFLVRIPNNQFFQKAIRCHRGSDTTSLKQALFERRGEKSKEP